MRILVNLIITISIIVGLFYVYENHWDDVYFAFFGEQNTYTMYVDKVALEVTLADTPQERQLGLSGTASLPDLHGKIFVFDESAKHGIWMKDMNYPIDILWIDENLQIVHFEEDVSPGTYPTVFSPQTPSRFVLETNAFFISTYRIEKGDYISLPPSILPNDVRDRLLSRNARN